MLELSGPRVRLRLPLLDDLDVLVAAASLDPQPMAGSDTTMRDTLRARIERRPTLEDGGFLGLVVEHDGALVGDIQARAPTHGMPPGVCEIGITLFPTARGRGLGQEAVALLTDHLLDEGYDRVQATTSTTNVPMRRLLERLGYACEGVLQDYAPASDGGREDYAMYAVTARDRRPPD